MLIWKLEPIPGSDDVNRLNFVDNVLSVESISHYLDGSREGGPIFNALTNGLDVEVEVRAVRIDGKECPR